MAIPGYKVLKKINEGGMATVYLAIQLSVGREVALKIMSPELSADPKYSNLFYKEANIVGTLSHPNIVSIYDVGKDNEGHNYIAMDYLPGASFKERINNGLSISEVLRITKEIASALDHMHDRGYVHLDLKPDNILFRSDGAAVLLDFGIAMTMSAAQKANSSGSVAGTPQYMSPEQAQGKPLDGRSDIYSLGIMFHEMLTGEPPYNAHDAVQIAVKHMTAPLPSLPVQFKMFQPLLNKMIAKKTESRFLRGSEIIQAINALEGGIGGRDAILLEPTQPTALQAFSLIRALMAALGALFGLLVKRFFGRFEFMRRLRFSPRHGLVLRNPVDPLALMSMAGKGSNLNADTQDNALGETLEQALANHHAKRLAPPVIVYALLLLVAGAAAAGVWQGMQGKPQAAEVAVASTPAAPAGAPAQTTQAAPATGTAPAAATAAAPVATPKYRLKIVTVPEDADIRIVELNTAYKADTPLEKGHYTIEVTHKDYWLQDKAIDLVTDQELVVRLTPKQHSYASGEVFQDELPDGAKAPSMVVLPKGEFTMGDATGKLDNARPAHRVKISRSIAAGRYEVTWGEYQHYLRVEKLETPTGVGGRGENQPVTGVNWDDAKAYTNWLAKTTGKPYRLLTEAEWEYAARAGTDTPYWWGTAAKDQANCRRGCTTTWSNNALFEPMVVGSFKANPFGLFDTAGNAAEWVEDCFADSYQGAPEDGSAYIDKDHCYYHVVRGGSFDDPDNRIVSRAREKGFAQMRKRENGFRVALDL